jgi:hypothetical protein
MQKFNVITWIGYHFSKFSIYSNGKDDRDTMENIGVMVEAKTMWFSSMKDKNLILAYKVFYGVIEEILEIDYVIFIVPLCK